MIRWLGLWRLVVGRVRSDLAFLFALWLLVVSAITLLAAGSLYAQTVDAGGLRRALAESAAGARGVSVGVTTSPTELEQLDASIRRRVTGALGADRADVIRTVRSSALLPLNAQAADAEPGPLAVLGAYEGLADHVELIAGEWPVAGRQPLEASLSQGAAAALGLGLGDRLALADASTPGADVSDALAEVRIVAIYEVDVEDVYWLGSQMEREGIELRGSAQVAGPLMVDPVDLAAHPRLTRLEVDWRGLPRVERLRVADLPGLRARIAGLASAIEGDLADDRSVTVNAALADVLAGIDRAALASRSGVVLITLQFAALAGCAVLLVGGILAERRRPEVALLRARGASSAEIGLLAAGEAGLLTVPAALLAPLIALALVGGIGGWGAIGESGIIGAAQLDEASWLVTLGAAIACIVALTLPALAAELDLARVRAALGRPLTQGAGQRLGLDLVLLALAVLGLIQLRSYGTTLTRSADASLQLDPLLVAAPAIALVAGAILVVRLIPRLGQLAEWLLRRRPTMVPPYGARRAARRPLRLARWALLIVLAAALGTFGALYTETWTRSQLEQAAYQAGADVRVTRRQHGTRPTEMNAGLAALDGVTALSAVTRAQLDVGRAVRQATVLVVEPESLALVADLPRNSSGDLRAAIGLLASERPAFGALELPATARRLAVMLEADLEADTSGLGHDFDLADWPGISVTPVVDIGGDAWVRLPVATALMQGEQRLAFDLPPIADATAGAGRLVALELTAGGPVPAFGLIELQEILASPSADGDDWQSVADARALTDWAFIFHRSAVQQPGTFPGGASTHDYGGPLIDFPIHAPLPACPSWDTAEPGCQHAFADTYRWSASSAEPALPAIASEAFLSAAGASVGDAVGADWFAKVDLQLVGSVGEFPSLDPARPFVLVDKASLNRLRAARQLEPTEPNEWWLSAAPEAVPSVTSAALQPPISAGEVVSRAELTRSLQRDPIALGMVGSLLLGSLAAAVFAALALLVGAVVSAREQTGELALLRAVGLSAPQALRLLSLESAFLLVLGLLTGALVGGVIGALVLPTAPLNRSGTQVVPTPEVVFPWQLAGLVLVAALALIVLVTLISWREIHRQQMVDVLRQSAD